MIRCSLAAFAAVWAIAALGCGNVDGRYPVSGNVTLQGQPLASGAIIFESADGGSRGGTTITDGEYSLPADQGLLPGAYTVRVSAVQSQAEVTGPPGPEAAAIELANKDIIPDEFNAQSTLKHEVGPDKPTEFNVTIP